jgi:hypothetical protein
MKGLIQGAVENQDRYYGEMEGSVRVQELQLQGEQPLCSGGCRSEDRDVKYAGKLDIKSHTGSRSEMNGENAP